MPGFVLVRVLGTTGWIYTSTYYDKYGRVIQQNQSNPDGGYSRTSTTYNFTGQPIKQQVVQRQTVGAGPVTTETTYAYDHMGRPTTTTFSYDGATAVTLSENTYDEIGRLEKKTLHNGNQEADYSYNIRGWLTKINDPDDSYTIGKAFSEELYYNTTGELANLSPVVQYNGNLSGMRWRNDNTTRSAYAYRYDGLNRLTKGDYGSITTTGNVTNTSNYDLYSVGYDANGNITGLNRKNSSGTDRENLAYTYAGNQLSSLTGTYGGSSITGKTFSYDANGNATTDNLRGLTVEYFDELDLPKKYTSSDGSQYAQYTYDAAGTKWGKTVSGTGTTTLKYEGSFIYQDGALDRVLTSEGFYRSGLYHYYLKDHLGNTRMVVSYSGSAPAVEQVTEYYPFGSLFTDNNLDKNKYLYNGKELQDEFFENYDYGARFYDPELGRWHVIDPSAENYNFQSTYAYAANNPMKYIDFMGMGPDSTQAQSSSRYDFFMSLYNGTRGTSSKFEFGNSGASQFVTTDSSSGQEDDDAANSGGTKSTLDKFNYLASLKATGASAYYSAMLNRWSMYRPLESSILSLKGSSKYMSAFKGVNAAKGVGFGLTGVGIVYDYTIGVPRYNKGISDEWSVSPQKARLNTGVALYSLTINPAIGILYFGIDAFYPGGLGGYMNDTDRIIQRNQEILGPGWNMYRMEGGLK